MMTNDDRKAIQLISEAATLLGWEITFDATSDDVSYIIIAKPNIIEKLIDKIEG